MAYNSSSKTPTKVKLSPSSSSRSLSTPSKKSQPVTGVARTVFTHGSTLQSLLNDWRRLSARGTTVCRAVLALRLHECEEEEYPERLAPLLESLLEALGGLQGIIDSMHIIEKQLQAVSSMQPTEEPIIGSWSGAQVSQEVSRMCLEYQQDYALKKYVTESLAQCRDEAVSEALASAWELQPHVDPARELYLLTDLGLSLHT